MQANNILKIISCLCFILITIALLLISNSSATGYESSIYSSTPFLAWIFLILSIFCGIGIIVHQVYTNKIIHSNLWVLGLILIFMSNTIILSLHILRDYALWNAVGDSGLHLGWIKDIILSGHIHTQNFYPIIHIFSAQISLILGVDPVIPYKWLPVFFALLYMVFIYFLAVFLLPHKGQVILATVAGSALLHGWYLCLSPAHLSNLAFPLGLYFFYRSFFTATLQWKILFLIFVFLFPAFHPVSSFVLLLILLIVWLYTDIILTIFTKSSYHINENSFRFNSTIVLLLLVLSITWLSSFYIWEATLQNLFTLVNEGGSSHLTALADNIKYAEGYGFSIGEYFLKMFSGIGLYVILAIVAFPILWKNRMKNEKFNKVVVLYSLFAAFSLMVIVLFFGNMGFGPLRLLIYIVVICTLPVGFILFEYIKWAKIRKNQIAKITPFMITILLCFVSIIGISYLYPSPYTLSLSEQSTQSEILGMNWLFHNKNISIYYSGWYFTPSVFSAFLLTPEEREQRGDLTPYTTTSFPFHFGYDNNSSMLGQFYENDVYLVIKEAIKRVYIDVYPSMAKIRLLPSDFIKLENDRSVDKLYSNGGFDLWYIHSINIEHLNIID